MVEDYKSKLKRIMDEYVQFVYNITRSFPKEEMFSSVSQWRRSTLSIILNYLEGYARKKSLVQLNFYEISYGSLKESKYLLYFALKQNYIKQNEYDKIYQLVEEIGKMLWTEIRSLEDSLKK